VFELPRTHDAPALARRYCARCCEEWHVPHLRPACELLVSELVTNAVVHGRGEITLEVVDEGERICVSILDDDVSERTVQHPDDITGSGRGLLIVAALAERWGADVGGGRTRAWFELCS
jgi:anti-sigma regulatory factor (Ser/Thr protein kinase)